MTTFIQTKTRICLTFLLMATAMFALVLNAKAQQQTPSLIIAWYESLQANDPGAVSALLDAGAVIELEDLGISQNKQEFVSAMDQWAAVNGGAQIRFRSVKNENNIVEMEVCYRFASNEVFNLETFELSGNQILKSVQTQLSETCEDL